MKNEKKNKWQNIFLAIKYSVVICLLGLVYIFIFQRFHIGIPCVFNKITGYQCPGCGMTHALSEMVRGNFYEALQFNVLSLTVLPVVAIYLFYRLVRENAEDDKEFYIWEYILLVVLFVIVLLYGYLRNK